MRALALLLALVPSLALAAGPTISGGSGFVGTGPRILGENAFALECLLSANPNCTTSTSSTPITTTRASPVPCEVGGTWTTVGANTACVGPRGLESWPQVTNYWANSGNPTLWAKTNATVTADGDGWFTITDTNASGPGSVSPSAVAVASGETWILHCPYRAGTVGVVYLQAFGVASTPSCPAGAVGCTTNATSCLFSAPADGRLSCTFAFSASGSITPAIGSNTTATGTFKTQYCQLEKSPTPGRRCDAGATATTCQADQHTVSTAGFPTARGALRFIYTPEPALPIASDATLAFLWDSRATNTGGLSVYIRRSDGALFVQLHGGGTSTVQSSVGLAWSGSSVVEVSWTPTTLVVRRGGVVIINATHSVTAGAHAPVARVGYDAGDATRSARGSLQFISVSE